jgi:hypothetical protein
MGTNPGMSVIGHMLSSNSSSASLNYIRVMVTAHNEAAHEKRTKTPTQLLSLSR